MYILPEGPHNDLIVMMLVAQPPTDHSSEMLTHFFELELLGDNK